MDDAGHLSGGGTPGGVFDAGRCGSVLCDEKTFRVDAGKPPSDLGEPAMAADVTADRLLNADKEPQNWLMNHRTYDGQRFSPLARLAMNASHRVCASLRRDRAWREPT